MNEYKVKVGEFVGPLDLLLDLIEKRKLHINDVSLLQVTDGFLDYIKNLETFPTEDVANFISIASTLILIKSVSLLPTLTITKDEEETIQELEERLRILKDVKEKAIFIADLHDKNVIYAREDRKNIISIFSPTSEITVEGCLLSIKRVLSGLPKREILATAIVKKVISLEEAIEGLIARVQADLKTSFSKLRIGNRSNDPTERKAEKVNVIISFLAILELVKRGIVMVKQEDHFRDFDIESGQTHTPIYN